jgi:hypothetical protein
MGNLISIASLGISNKSVIERYKIDLFKQHLKNKIQEIIILQLVDITSNIFKKYNIDVNDNDNLNGIDIFVISLADITSADVNNMGISPDDFILNIIKVIYSETLYYLNNAFNKATLNLMIQNESFNLSLNSDINNIFKTFQNIQNYKLTSTVKISLSNCFSDARSLYGVFGKSITESAILHQESKKHIIKLLFVKSFLKDIFNKTDIFEKYINSICYYPVIVINEAANIIPDTILSETPPTPIIINTRKLNSPYTNCPIVKSFGNNIKQEYIDLYNNNKKTLQNAYTNKLVTNYANEYKTKFDTIFPDYFNPKFENDFNSQFGPDYNKLFAEEYPTVFQETYATTFAIDYPIKLDKYYNDNYLSDYTKMYKTAFDSEYPVDYKNKYSKDYQKKFKTDYVKTFDTDYKKQFDIDYQNESVNEYKTKYATDYVPKFNNYYTSNFQSEYDKQFNKDYSSKFDNDYKIKFNKEFPDKCTAKCSEKGAQIAFSSDAKYSGVILLIICIILLFIIIFLFFRSGSSKSKKIENSSDTKSE